MAEPAADDLARDARAHLERLLASKDFDASERNRRFLRFVVDAVLDGQGDRVKAYTIATSVFGRDASFDPQTDSIVRIEARRLRRALERYYLLEGRGEAFRIDIPTGSYVPEFRRPTAAVPASAPRDPAPVAPSPRTLPAVLVGVFEAEGDPTLAQSLARGFARHLVTGLTRFTDLVVFGHETSLAYGGREPLLLREELDVDFVLTGTVAVAAGGFRVDAILVDARTGRAIWADGIERRLDPERIYEVRDEIADRVVRTLAQPYGVIFAHRARETDGRPPGRITSYDGIAMFHQYERNFDPQLHAEALRCLEEIVRAEPEYAEAHACMARLLLDAVRFGIGPADTRERGDGEGVEHAFALAKRAAALAPVSSRSHQALSHAYWHMGDVDAAIRELDIALDLNPNDTTAMAYLGIQLAVRGEWARAIPLIEESFRRNPAQSSFFRLGFALHHYAEGRWEAALNEAMRVDTPGLVYGHLIVAVSAIRLGNRRQADAAVARIRALAPDYGWRVADDLAARRMSHDLVQSLIEGVRLTGLTAPKLVAGRSLRTEQ